MNEPKKTRKLRKIKTAKGHESKARIVNAALDLIRERGYEQTTMRAIAEAAGVSLGNAYHYFPSKAHLIQEFYSQTHEHHKQLSRSTLDSESSFKERLRSVLRLKISTLEPYHQFSGMLFKTAADPQSPLNPFADESAPVRLDSIRLFEEISNSSGKRLSKDLQSELPYLLWLYHMGVILFWIHDSSPKQRRTYRLIDMTVDLLDKLISLASNPLMSPVRKKALSLISEIRDDINEDLIAPEPATS